MRSRASALALAVAVPLFEPNALVSGAIAASPESPSKFLLLSSGMLISPLFGLGLRHQPAIAALGVDVPAQHHRVVLMNQVVAMHRVPSVEVAEPEEKPRA